MEADIKTLLVGSLIVTGIAMVVAVPVGLGSAVYLSEYAGERSRKVIKPVLEILAGIPSVVLGFFALTWISPNIVQRLNDESSIFNLMAAGLGVGILTIPLMASISEDAMYAVPGNLREASYGLGATKRTTSLRVVVPAATSGIVACPSEESISQIFSPRVTATVYWPTSAFVPNALRMKASMRRVA